MTHIKRIDEYNSSLFTYARNLEREMMKRCSYNGIVRDKDTGREYPNHMGDLLDEYGFECEWSIRPKEFRVDAKTYPNEQLVVIWISQDSIDDETSVECLKDMFIALFNDTTIPMDSLIEQGYDIVFKCGVRDDFNFDNPQYLWKLASDENGGYEIVDARGFKK